MMAYIIIVYRMRMTALTIIKTGFRLLNKFFMKKIIPTILFLMCTITAKSQNPYLYRSIDYFANEIQNEHSMHVLATKFTLLNIIIRNYRNCDEKNLKEIQQVYGEKKIIKLKHKYLAAEKDVNLFLDSMDYFLTTYGFEDLKNSDSVKYVRCAALLRTAIYSMRDLNVAIKRKMKKIKDDSTVVISIDKKESIEIVLKEFLKWKPLYRNYEGEAGTEKYIQVLKGSYWKSWKELQADPISK